MAAGFVQGLNREKSQIRHQADPDRRLGGERQARRRRRRRARDRPSRHRPACQCRHRADHAPLLPFLHHQQGDARSAASPICAAARSAWCAIRRGTSRCCGSSWRSTRSGPRRSTIIGLDAGRDRPGGEGAAHRRLLLDQCRRRARQQRRRRPPAFGLGRGPGSHPGPRGRRAGGAHPHDRDRRDRPGRARRRPATPLREPADHRDHLAADGLAGSRRRCRRQPRQRDAGAARHAGRRAAADPGAGDALDRQGCSLPVHVGAAAFIDGEQKTFFERYGDWFYLGVMGLVRDGHRRCRLLGRESAARRRRAMMGLDRLLALLPEIRSTSDDRDARSLPTPRPTRSCSRCSVTSAGRSRFIRHRGVPAGLRSGQPGRHRGEDQGHDGTNLRVSAGMPQFWGRLGCLPRGAGVG